jgi:ABC-type spermidine/putrescine transport system permease subunit II
MDPLASIAAEPSNWAGFGVSLLTAFAVAAVSIALGVGASVVWEWRRMVGPEAPQVRRTTIRRPTLRRTTRHAR